jgi:hypothetical protein
LFPFTKIVVTLGTSRGRAGRDAKRRRENGS